MRSLNCYTHNDKKLNVLAVINTTNSLLLLVSQNTCNKQDLTFVSFSLFRLQAFETTACLKVYPLSLIQGKFLKILLLFALVDLVR